MKYLVQFEIQLPAEKQHLYFNGAALLDDTKSLEEVGILNGDLLTVLEVDLRETSRVANQGPSHPSRMARNDQKEDVGPPPYSRVAEDPFEDEAQRKIEEMIRQESVLENLNTAYERTPECKQHQSPCISLLERLILIYSSQSSGE